MKGFSLHFNRAALEQWRNGRVTFQGGINSRKTPESTISSCNTEVLGGHWAPQSSTLAWKIPWMEEPGRLQSMGSLRVRHDWATSLSLFTFLHWRRKWQPTPEFLPGESQGREAWWAALYGSHRVGYNWSDLEEEDIVKTQEQEGNIVAGTQRSNGKLQSRRSLHLKEKKPESTRVKMKNCIWIRSPTGSTIRNRFKLAWRKRRNTC